MENGIYFEMLLFVYSLTILIGIVGNIINIFVFRTKSMYKIPTSRLLYFLSISDLLLLSLCATDPIMTFMFNYQIRLESTSFCKIHVFLTYFLSHLSSIILMIVCIERSLLIQNIRLNIFQIQSISKTISVIAFLIGLINGHFLFLFSLSSEKLELNSNYSINISLFLNELKLNLSFEGLKPAVLCYSTDMTLYSYFLNNIWNWIDTSIYSIIPFIIMIISSILILIQIRKNDRNFKGKSTTIGMKQKKRNNKIALMLITTNFSFILFSLLYDIISNNMMESNSILILTAHLLAYSNNSFNFVFYALFSSQYKSILCGMFKTDEIEDLANQYHMVKLNSKLNSRTDLKSKSDFLKNYEKIISEFNYIDEE